MKHINVNIIRDPEHLVNPGDDLKRIRDLALQFRLAEIDSKTNLELEQLVASKISDLRKEQQRSQDCDYHIYPEGIPNKLSSDELGIVTDAIYTDIIGGYTDLLLAATLTGSHRLSRLDELSTREASDFLTAMIELGVDSGTLTRAELSEITNNHFKI